MSLTPAFEGEVQFRRWSDSSTQGVQVTFALPDSEALEPLKHKAGKRFMAVLVEIGDDEQPVQQPPKKDQRGPLCREACDYCKLPMFRAWIKEACPDYGIVDNEYSARQWVLDTCQIKSRADLDSDAEAADDFKRFVRLPFMKWQRERTRVGA
jgi:hypothetical protein